MVWPILVKLSLAKGLSVGLDVPIIGVHHMVYPSVQPDISKRTHSLHDYYHRVVIRNSHSTHFSSREDILFSWPRVL
jgi:hypothetical protein